MTDTVDTIAINEGRLRRYVDRRFEQSGDTTFPTVREAARSLRMSQAEIRDLAQEWPFMLTSYYTASETPLGDHFIEICE